MTANSEPPPGESQARRLEAVCEQVAMLLSHVDGAGRLRAAAGNEWSVTQVLGHMVEMIPYWLGHCRTLISATGEPPVFGRRYDSPERVAGIERGATGDPMALVAELRRETTEAARAIREMASTERSRKGIHIKLGEISVADAVEHCIVAHAEEHLEQIRTALGNDRPDSSPIPGSG